MAESISTLSSSNRNSLDTLPVEIIAQICGFLTTTEVSYLTATSKLAYLTVQSSLYRHVRIDSFEALALLARSLSLPALLDRLQPGGKREILTLRTCFDRLRSHARNLNPTPASVLISRMIQSLSRFFPEIHISLCFLNSPCRINSATKFAYDKFPRVTKLVLFLGTQTDDLEPQIRNQCVPNLGFWRPLLNGDSFPDLKSVQIYHHWASIPSQGANILKQANRCKQQDYGLNIGRDLGPCPGLEKLEEIILENPPELNGSILLEILNNPDSKAVNLKNLELRFCNLEVHSLAFLLQQEIDTLTHFTLLIGMKETQDFTRHHPGEPSPHLCPLLRCFSKNLVYFRYAASCVCRELFFDKFEMHRLKEDGVRTKIGILGGASDSHIHIDRHAIRQIITSHRVSKALTYRNARIRSAMADAQARTSAINMVTSKINAELELDREEETRLRRINDSKTPWKRSIVTWSGLCDYLDTWDELQEAANMEEAGIEWVLTNCHLSQASRHISGMAEERIDMDEELVERFET